MNTRFQDNGATDVVDSVVDNRRLYHDSRVATELVVLYCWRWCLSFLLLLSFYSPLLLPFDVLLH